MPNLELLDPGAIALIQQLPNGRIRQIGLTAAHSQMLQALIGSMSQVYPLPALAEEYDLVLKSEVDKQIAYIKVKTYLQCLKVTIEWLDTVAGVSLNGDAVKLLTAEVDKYIKEIK